MEDMRIGCENCTKCFAGCPKPFPEEYMESGAESCEGFNEEKDPEKVYSNMERWVEETKDQLSEKGIYV